MQAFLILFSLFNSLVFSQTFLAFPTTSKIEVSSEISLTIENVEKPFDCKLNEVSKLYFCKNGDQKILAKMSYGSFMAVGRNKNDAFGSLMVENVKAKEKIIFDKNSAILSNFPFSKDDLKKDYLEQVVGPREFFNLVFSSKAQMAKLQTGDDDYQEFVKKSLEEVEANKNKFQFLSSEKQFEIELAEGPKIKCNREENATAGYTCGSFQCEEITLKGKKYKPVMMYDSSIESFVGPQIYLVNSEGIGPEVIINKIHSEKIKKPVADFSAEVAAFKKREQLENKYDPYELIIPKGIENREIYKKIKHPQIAAYMEAYKQLCAKESPGINSLLDSKQKMIEKLAELDMVELIKVLENGELFGFYISPNAASNYGCLYNGVILDKKAFKNLDKIKKTQERNPSPSQTIDMKRAEELFKKARAMKDISWNYKLDGCYARAHLMARRFEKEGVLTDKVWIKGDLNIPNSKPPERWNFHVAPIVYVKEGGEVKKMVIDPSLFDKPVTIEEWDKIMTKNTVKGSSMTSFPFPENAAALERSVLAISSSDPYLPGESIKLSEKEKMNLANQTMKQYLKIKEQ